MKIKLLFLSTFLFSLSIHAQINFEPHIIIGSHPDIVVPYNLVSADIDGDGDKDIVATSTNGHKVVWFENLDGQGNFSAPKILQSNMINPLDIAVADIDGDGDLDVVAVSMSDHKIVWFENLDGQGNFGPQQNLATLHRVYAIQAKDIDGDGDIDIIAGGDNKVIWLENLDGLGTFGPEKIVVDFIGAIRSIEIGDIDGDGDMDIVVADAGLHTTSWHENIDGLGTFGPARVITDDAFGSDSVLLIDLDNDGNPDVVSDFQIASIAWFKNNDGQGNFGNGNIIGSEMSLAHKFFAEDLNGNGNIDIIASNYDQHEIVWYENDGNGNFGNPHIVHSETQYPIGIIADDFNGDGKMDVAACFFGSDKIMWFENKGSLNVGENTNGHFSVYPNPTHDLLNIKSPAAILEISIYNNLGQLLYETVNTNQIDLSALIHGIYFMKIKEENGGIETIKVVRN